MKLYESDVQMAAWDFVENKKIDVIEEGADIDKEVSYICPICQKKYKKKINEWQGKQCDVCQSKEIFYYMSGKWKYGYYFGEIFRYFLILIFSILLSLITVEVEKFDIQFASMTVCYMIFFFGVYMLLNQYFNDSLIKNPQYQRFCLMAYLLLKQEDVFSLTRQIDFALAGLIKPYLPFKYSNEDIVYNIKTNGEYFYKSLNNKRKVKSLGKLIKNDRYFYQIVSDYETKNLINFKIERKIINVALEFLITFIGIFFAIVNYITSWERFGWKSLIVFIVFAILLFSIIIPLMKIRRKNKIHTAQMRLIVISSAIAKKYNQDAEKNMVVLEE